MKAGNLVKTPAGHNAVVTAVREDGLVWVRFTEPGSIRVPGGFPADALTLR